MKHAIALILAALAFTLPAPAQTLLEKTPAQQVAERLDASQAELIRHIESQLCAFHAALSNKETAQAILDAFGTKAGVALQRYAAARQFVISIDPTAEARIPAPDPMVYQVRSDGSVLYKAPKQPEIRTAPNP